MRIIKKKGFSMTELLAVVVILGILSTIVIVTYSQYISSSKKEKDKQNEELVVEAAKAYLNANIDQKPKTIGESTKITLETLRQSNYLKDDVKNSKNESCMDNSYVYVYKNSFTNYTYRAVLYCGDDEIKPEKEIPRPTVTDFSFSNMNDVNTASFSMILHGSEDEKIGIESYNYTITIINKSDTDSQEVYNSGAIDGREYEKISLKNILIRDYIDLTDYTSVKVSVIVRNTLGGVSEYTKTAYFEDKIAPKCSLVEGEAEENDWYNKTDITNGAKRQISIICNDEQGSGCVRDRFSKSWPNKDLKSVEYSTIKITDNSKNSNSTDCRVRVNIDNVAPTITISLLNNKSTIPLIKIASDGEQAIISSDEYPNLYNGWINYDNYKDGLEFQVNVNDDIYLYKYKWETAGTEAKEELFRQDSSDHTKSATFNISLKDDGYRTGKLTVYDKAGNITEILVNANIDRTAPNKPNTALYKWKDNSTRPSKVDGLTSYTPNTWSEKKIFTIASGSSDNLSGFREYQYTTRGTTTNVSNQKGTYRNIEARGISYIKYRACDNAGNCSPYNMENTVKIDLDGPTVSCGIDTKNRLINNVTVTDNQSEEQARYYSITTKKNTYNWSTTNTAGGNNCDTTYYAYVKAVDKVGNETIKSCGSYSRGSCCSSSSPSGCKWTTTCRSGITHLYFGNSTTPEFTDAGYARHGGGTEDRLYILEDVPEYESASGTIWIRVCATSFQINEWDYNTYYKPLEESITIDGETKKCHKLWVAKNCTGIYYSELNKKCTHDAPSTCPG